MGKEVKKIVYDCEELAAFMADAMSDYDNDDFEVVENKIYEKYNCEIDDFYNIINDLMPMMRASKSALSDQIFIGFADVNNKVFLLKKELKDE